MAGRSGNFEKTSWHQTLCALLTGAPNDGDIPLVTCDNLTGDCLFRHKRSKVCGQPTVFRAFLS